MALGNSQLRGTLGASNLGRYLRVLCLSLYFVVPQAQVSSCTDPLQFIFHTLDGSTSCIDLCDGLRYSIGRDCYNCDSECSGGCSGAGPNRCTCPGLSFLGTDNRTCVGCAVECREACVGPTERDCVTQNGTAGPSACANAYRAGVCVPACSSQHEYTAVSGECNPCSDQCALTASGGCIGPQASDCNACASVSLDGTCQSSCPVQSHYLAPDNTTCSVCDSNCRDSGVDAGCVGPLPSNCTACARFFRTESDGTPVCTFTCTAAEFAVPTSLGQECRACHSNCLGGCTGPGARECTVCRDFRHADGQCVVSCPTSINFVTPVVAQAPLCTPCSAMCASVDSAGAVLSMGCDGPLATDCNQCRDVRHPVDGCASDCGLAYFNETVNAETVCSPCNSLCSSNSDCSGPLAADCSECAFARHRGLCVGQCPSRTFYTTNSGDPNCIACHPQCRHGCSGAGDDACIASTGSALACLHNALPLASGGQRCVEECPALHWSNQSVCNACDAACASGGAVDCHGSGTLACTCAVGEYWDSGTLQCSACDTQCDVQGCDGSGPSRCLSCRSLQLQTQECVASCPRMHFNDSSSTCQPCSSNCSGADGCDGPLPDDCRSCVENAYINMSSLDCEPCHPLCSGCSGGSTSAQCTACAPQAVWHGGQCTPSCPAGTHHPVSTENGTQCAQCHPSCTADGCTGPGESGCRRCNTGVRNGTSGACLTNSTGAVNSGCPEQTWLIPRAQVWQPWLDNVCGQCHPACQTCTSAGRVGCVDCSVVRGRGGFCEFTCNANEAIVTMAGEMVCSCSNLTAFVVPASSTTRTTTTATTATTTTAAVSLVCSDGPLDCARVWDTKLAAELDCLGVDQRDRSFCSSLWRRRIVGRGGQGELGWPRSAPAPGHDISHFLQLGLCW
eukprot:m.293034 g.293034  ORF g.293034 m.293034 type:complete len:904 (-) comp27132_c2_seq1:961-3672(-)